MSLETWADLRIKKYNLLDIQLLKIGVAGFVLMIAKLWRPLLSLDWYWYAIIALLGGIKPVSRVLGK